MRRESFHLAPSIFPFQLVLGFVRGGVVLQALAAFEVAKRSRRFPDLVLFQPSILFNLLPMLVASNLHWESGTAVATRF